MLVMKAWLETRWRFLYALGVPLTALAFIYFANAGGAKPDVVLGMLSFFSVFAAIYLAGTGIRTQSPFRGGRGLHGSTIYTLSLPVSRLRLLLTRTGVGMMELMIINLMIYAVAWFVLPTIRGASTPVDLLQLAVAAFVCTFGFYFVSALLATFLDEQWQIFGGVAIFMGWRLLMTRLPVPRFADPLQFANHVSPLITHAMPWIAMAVSLGAAIALFALAWRSNHTVEY